MVTADWVLLCFCLLSILIGWNKGALRILSGIGSLFIAWQAARVFASLLAGWLYGLLGLTTGFGETGAWNSIYLFLDGASVFEKGFYVIAFIIIFVIVVAIIRAVAKGIRGIMRGNVLGAIDSAVGAFFGLFILAVIINLLTTLILPLAGGTEGHLYDLQVFLASSEIILPLLLGMTGYFLTTATGMMESLGLPQITAEGAEMPLLPLD